jgi:osmoprotectant transport system ATP-binding protein
MIHFDDLRYQVGTKTILRGLNLHVAAGETMVLLGRSGSGKTTALRMVNAMLQPSKGVVRVDGVAVHQTDPVQLRRSIGYVMQDVGLFPHWTVARNVATVPQLLGWPEDRTRERVEMLLADVGLPANEFAERYPHSLSGGQRQRVGVARALAAEPRLMLLDEPFGALDPITRVEMQDLFVRLREKHGITSIFVTHDLREAYRVGTRIALLRDGVVDSVGSPAEFHQAVSDEARAFLRTIAVPEEAIRP